LTHGHIKNKHEITHFCYMVQFD